MNVTAGSKSRDKGATGRRDLMASLCVLTLLIVFALSGLALEENWSKLWRVLIGFSAYVFALLLAIGVYDLKGKRRAGLPFLAFALAGAAAETSSGWLRPAAGTTFDLWTALAAALLIGGTHWLALRAWRPLRRRILQAERRSAA
jgi:hypothetical protein